MLLHLTKIQIFNFLALPIGKKQERTFIFKIIISIWGVSSYYFWNFGGGTLKVGHCEKKIEFWVHPPTISLKTKTQSTLVLTIDYENMKHSMSFLITWTQNSHNNTLWTFFKMLDELEIMFFTNHSLINKANKLLFFYNVHEIW